MPRNTRAIINLKNIKANYLLANRWAPCSKNIAVIKADAYGHGMVAVATHLQEIVPAFAVAIFDEAVILREAGVSKNILILQGVSTQEEVRYASEYELWITIHDIYQLKLILSTPIKKTIKVWVKIDTGMHRLGLDLKELKETIKAVEQCPWIDKNYVVSSHFSCASELNNDETNHQLQRFKQMIQVAGVSAGTSLSLSNSPAMANVPEANFDWNRPGLMLYGLPLFNTAHRSDSELKVAMTFQSEIVAIRDIPAGKYVGYGKTWRAERPSRIATVSVGYADGYPRQAANGTPVLVNGEFAKLAGVVSMDLISIDVTDMSAPTIGDTVELWGEGVCANEIAGYANTIGYDLITGIGQRVPRVYRK